VTSLDLSYQGERMIEGEDGWVAASSYATGQEGSTGTITGMNTLHDMMR
jgi:hypothetical protein